MNAILDYLDKFFIAENNNKDRNLAIFILQVDGSEATGKTTILKSIDYAFNRFFESTANNLIIRNTSFISERVKELKKRNVVFRPAIRFKKALQDRLNEATYQQSIKESLLHIAKHLFGGTNSGVLVLLRDALLAGFLTYLSIPEQLLPEEQYQVLIEDIKTFQQDVHKLVKQELEFLGASIQSIVTNKKPKNLILAYDRFLLSNLAYSVITEFIVNCKGCSDFSVQTDTRNGFYAYVTGNTQLQAQILDMLLASPYVDNTFETILVDRIKQFEKIMLLTMSSENMRCKTLLYQIDNDAYGFDTETRFDVYRQLLLTRYARQTIQQTIEDIDVLHQILKTIKVPNEISDFINAFAWYNVQIMDVLFDNMKKALYIQMPDHISVYTDIV